MQVYRAAKKSCTHALESFEEYLFAMLRVVKNVPGRASKIVLSLTRLSEHPKKRKGGPAAIPSERPLPVDEMTHTLAIEREIFEQSWIFLKKNLVPSV